MFGYLRRRLIRDVEHLKEVVQTCWEQIGQDVIDRAIPTKSDIFRNADDSLFKTILKNSHNVLYPYLPETQNNLRQRPHNKALIPKTTYLSDRDYIMRMLYKNCY